MSAQERRVISDKFHLECPIDAQMIMNLTSAVVVADVLFFVFFLLRRLFD